MPRIFVLSGPDVGARFDVASGATLGRDAECNVPLRDASVSRRHARLEERDGDWHVVDTGSRNGVFVRGARTPSAVLVDGDEFLVGEVLLRFRATLEETVRRPRPAHVGDEAARPAPPPAAPRAPSPAPVPTPGGAGDDAGEIVLEGEWDESAAASAAERAAQRPGARLPEVDDRTHVQPLPVRPGAGDAARAAKRASAGAPAAPGGAAARGVLQYHKVERRAGWFGADFDQISFGQKLVVTLVALALLVLVGWLAFRGGAFLRGERAPTTAEDVEPGATGR